MAYDKQSWVLGIGGGTPLNATRLNYIETGVAAAHSLIADLAAAHHTHVSADITDATATNVVNTIVERDSTGSISVSAVTGLSSATGSTQAVPKSQLDSAVSGLAPAVHTHTLSQISDMTATGVAIASAVDTTSVVATLDVPTNDEMNTSIAAAIATVATTDSVTAAIATSEAYTDSVTTGGVYVNRYTTQWPLRQNTSVNGRVVFWVGPSATPVALTGSTSGGTRAAAPGDLIYYY